MAETHTGEMAGQLARWKARGGGKAAQEEPRGPAQVIQLPLWPEPKRGAPNAVLRGALFAAVHKDRRYMDRELLTAQDGIMVRFTGKQLDQSDLDVWEQVLHLARPQALGTEVLFHRPRLSQGPGPSIDRHDRRMTGWQIGLCSAGCVTDVRDQSDKVVGLTSAP